MKGKHESHHREHEDRKRGGRAHRRAGGEAERSPEPLKADRNPHVFREAEEARNLGKIGGVKSKSRADRKRGGACRASGGGADVTPYSSAGRALRKRGGTAHHGHGHR